MVNATNPEQTNFTWQEGLTGPALEIASTANSPLRVSAGPGTGKTFALMRRVARLLEEGVSPESIFMVSFTRTAARDLVSNLERLNVPGADAIRVGTLHSFCFQVLGRNGVLEVTGRVPRPLMRYEVRFLFEDLKQEGRGIRDCERMLHAFEASWARLQHETPGWPLGTREQQFHRDLMGWLTYHKCMLIGELVTEMHKYLRDNPACPERRAFDHVLVDEFQDLNKADQEVIGFLAERASLTIIGDEDQAIYAKLRYAQPEGLRDFAESHPGTHDIPLEVCRRCPRTVVAMANSLISHNSIRRQRSMLPYEAQTEGTVKIVQWPTMEEEADGIADFIQRYLADHPAMSLRDVLVLTPRRSIGYRIRDALVQRNIVAHSYFFEEALEQTRAQERFTLLSLLVNRNDRVSLRCWLGFGHATLSAVPYRRLREYCLQHEIEPIDALEMMRNGSLKLPHCGGLVERYKMLLNEIENLDDAQDEALVDLLFPDGDADVAHVRRLARMAIETAETEMTPASLLGELRTRIIFPEPPPLGEYVRVMSLHKSKGLTAKLTIVAGCVEGYIPSLDRNVTDLEAERDLEEQRRLFYVAMTRPTDTLVISSFLSMPLAEARAMQVRLQRVEGARGYVQASRFLAELGPMAPVPQTGTLL